MPAGDYYLRKKECPSPKRTGAVKYLILDDEENPLLEAEGAFSAGGLHSVVLTTADVYRPVARLDKLGDDTFAVDISGPVGAIEKTNGWHYRDREGRVQLGLTKEAHKPPSVLAHLLSIAVSDHPAFDDPVAIYRFWQCGEEGHFASYFGDLDTLEISEAESILTPYLCIFLVLATLLTADNQA